jgi:hypothetical protein
VLLDNGVVLKYILRGSNQLVQSFDCGIVLRGGLKIRGGQGVVVEHLSVSRLRSWCIVGSDGESIDGDMLPGDYARLR